MFYKGFMKFMIVIFVILFVLFVFIIFVRCDLILFVGISEDYGG